MSENQSNKSSEQWIDLIAKTELPAITSTAKMLDKFSDDDISSLPKLSNAILHDQALSSCILKVANSIQYMGVKKVTTVSRATVILGIHSVKNICLTSKLVDGLLRSKDLNVAVYKRLTRLMSNSFYAGLLAKMMVPDYSDDTQEEVYLAAMMYRIGETAFWSTGGKPTEKLIKAIGLPQDEFAIFSEKELGVSFNELSIGLAQTWNLGELLTKALDNPKSRTVEMQIIYYADQLATFIDCPPDSMEEFNQLLDDIAEIMQVSVKHLRLLIEKTRDQAKKLLHSYGAFALKDLIKPLPTINDFGHGSSTSLAVITKEAAFISAIKQLTALTKSSRDINEFLQTSLKSLVRVFELDRTTFFILADGKKYIKSRFSFDKELKEEEIRALIHLAPEENIVSKMLQNNLPVLIDDARKSKWKKYINREIATLVEDGAIGFVPVKVGDKVIGVIAGQVFDRTKGMTTEDFDNFCYLVEHLNMCLTIILHR